MKNLLKNSVLLGSCLLALSACKAKTETVSNQAPNIKAEQANIPLDATPLERMEQALALAQTTAGDGNPAMWKLADNDTTVYLYGTVHLLPPELDWKTPEFEQAFESADKLFLEADLKSPDAVKTMQAAMMREAMFTDGQSLKTVLSEDQYEKVSTAISAFGIPAGAMDGAKPWTVSLQLMAGEMMKNGYNPELGVDSVLEASASASGKSFGFFETASDQIKLLAGSTLDEQVEALMFQVETLDKTNDMFDILVGEWADGDTKGLGVIMGDPAMFGSVEGYNAMIKDRNANWIPQIEAILEEPGTSFIAVGAGHLAGPDSVITMLQDKGHKVEVVQ